MPSTVSKWVLALTCAGKLLRGSSSTPCCQDLPLSPLLPLERHKFQEASAPGGGSNSQRLSASSVSAKTQQIINYDFSQMLSHIPCRHACVLGGKRISQQQKVACCFRLAHAALSTESAHAARKPSGKWEPVSENQSVLEASRAMETELWLSRSQQHRTKGGSCG